MLVYCKHCVIFVDLGKDFVKIVYAKPEDFKNYGFGNNFQKFQKYGDKLKRLGNAYYYENPEPYSHEQLTEPSPSPTEIVPPTFINLPDTHLTLLEDREENSKGNNLWYVSSRAEIWNVFYEKKRKRSVVV